MPLPDYVKLALEGVTSYTAGISDLLHTMTMTPSAPAFRLFSADQMCDPADGSRLRDLSTATHTPVLVEECLEALAVRPGESYIDATIGLGGHAERILLANAPNGRLLGIDADPGAIRRSAERLSRYGDRVVLVSGNFREIGGIAASRGFTGSAGLLFDLGMSSLQLSEAGRGFSFQFPAPLDMRMDPGLERTAADLVNELHEGDLVTLLQRYGEEPAARHIARALVRRRPFRTTIELAAAIEAAAPRRGARTHPATRTFQALRIAVNDELGSLEQALAASLTLLRTGGRLAAISFHSLEDRIVKDFIRSESRDCICPPALPLCTCSHRAALRSLRKSVIRPSFAETAANSRSRSARLRIAERV